MAIWEPTSGCTNVRCPAWNPGDERHCVHGLGLLCPVVCGFGAPLPEGYWRRLDPSYYDQWIQDWGNYILILCQKQNIHLISIQDLVKYPGFNNPRKSLEIDAFVRILNFLISKKLAKWWNSEHTLIRVYWRTLEQWANTIYSWGIEGGGLTLDIYSLQQANKSFSTLPTNDLLEILTLLVKDKKAEWFSHNPPLIRLTW